MAIVWSETINNTRYEVRRAGHSIRLYTDGVFHSQYNPNRPITGSIWDLLLLPVFFYPQHSIKRILVLGVGGGAVMRQLDYFLSPQLIKGVELNAVHIEIAKRFFGLGQQPQQVSTLGGKRNKLNTNAKINIQRADAVDWLKKYNGAKFDMIIDDLFGEESGEPVRAIAADANWFKLVSKHLNRRGLLVINFVSRSQARRCGYFTNHAIQQSFKDAFQFTSTQYENAIAAFLGIESNRRIFHNNLAKHPELDTRKKSCRLRYQLSRIVI